MKPKILVILGPTAVGKSALALELAAALDAEIVNADSQQVYRYMDIGTGKPSAAEREAVPHHLIDVVQPDQPFDAALFRRLAAAAIGDIHTRRKHAIVCGGTGLYLRALLHGLVEAPERNPAIRRSLEDELAQRGLAALYERLAGIDPKITSTIHPHDRQRIIRALEVYRCTGKPLSSWHAEHGFREQPFDALEIGVARERGELYALIDRRSERMIAAGLLDEVRGLIARGFGLELPPLQSVGYRQMGAVIRQELALDEAAEAMKQETRRLAKRQLTWFRRDDAIRWFHPEEQKKEIFGLARAFLERSRNGRAKRV
jgi:tRNA dimethylallyltransferase